MTKHNQFVIAVDFDGTLCEHVYPDIGPAAVRAKDWLETFTRCGAKLILWTMRCDSESSGPVLTDAVNWCKNTLGIEFWAVNNNPNQSWSMSPKCYAHAYIDDMAVGCPLRQSGSGRAVVDWDIVGPIVVELIRAHNEKHS